jgi:hypothetical protein
MLPVRNGETRARVGSPRQLTHVLASTLLDILAKFPDPSLMTYTTYTTNTGFSSARWGPFGDWAIPEPPVALWSIHPTYICREPFCATRAPRFVAQ